MQRWFFADEAEACDTSSSVTTTSSTMPSVIAVPDRPWTFRVLVNVEIAPNERLALVGDCHSLGNWKPNDCVLMNKEDSADNIWSGCTSLPSNRSTEYRYFICAIDQLAGKIIVRRWETHLQPRRVPQYEENALVNKDIFGVVGSKEKVDRGWLTSETIVQLKFFNAPFTWKQRMKNRLMYVKVTPMNLKIKSACDNTSVFGSSTATSLLEDSVSNDTYDTREYSNDLSTAFAFNEVVTLKVNDSEIKSQPQFGTPCSPDDLIIFHLTIGDFENTAYLIDLYTYGSKAASDEPPWHFGYHYVLPSLFKRSAGYFEVPITCASKHRPMGMMKVGYLIVNPLTFLTFDMRISYTRYWNKKWTGLDVGHRGLGISFKEEDNTIRENTITSLKNAAFHGADMVEFDVQLSKDLVPVVYHDFIIYVSLKSKNHNETHDYLALPMQELTLDQLSNLKVYHKNEGRSRETRCFDNEDLQEHQPFPQLADVLDAIDPHVGFNVEVKWSQQLVNGKMEEDYEHAVDRNLYVDCILEVVFKKAGNRRIVFSCFDPDICTMLRFKQNQYPVMFLSLGVTDKYLKFMDPRGNTVDTALCHAKAMELLGIAAHTEDLLRDPSQINLVINSGLVLFCWGEDNNSKDTIHLLKSYGVHAVIYDKIDVLSTKDVKKSVFEMNASETQKNLLKLQALEGNAKWASSMPTKH